MGKKNIFTAIDASSRIKPESHESPTANKEKTNPITQWEICPTAGIVQRPFIMGSSSRAYEMSSRGTVFYCF